MRRSSSLHSVDDVVQRNISNDKYEEIVAVGQNIEDVIVVSDALADGTILKDADIGVTVQAYDANTAKYSVAGTFVAPQRTYVQGEDNAIDFTVANNFETTAIAATITATSTTGCTGQSGTIIVHTAENITGWGAEFYFKNIPTDLTGTEIFSYFIENETTIWIGRMQ